MLGRGRPCRNLPVKRPRKRYPAAVSTPDRKRFPGGTEQDRAGLPLAQGYRKARRATRPAVLAQSDDPRYHPGLHIARTAPGRGTGTRPAAPLPRMPQPGPFRGRPKAAGHTPAQIGTTEPTTRLAIPTTLPTRPVRSDGSRGRHRSRPPFLAEHMPKLAKSRHHEVRPCSSPRRQCATSRELF